MYARQHDVARKRTFNGNNDVLYLNPYLKTTPTLKIYSSENFFFVNSG
jgi:hypothetical protein